MKTKAKTKIRAPIIKELNFTEEEKKEVKRIQTEEPWTKEGKIKRCCWRPHVFGLFGIAYKTYLL